MKIARNPNNVHPPLANYAHQIEIDGSCRWLNLSGQVGMTELGVLPESPLEQLEVALENIKRNLEAADMEISDLTKLTFYLVGEFEASERRRIIDNFLKENLVCMTMIYVAGLASKEIKVEVDAWACRIRE